MTCSIVELGFIRVASAKKGLAQNLASARADLGRIRATLKLEVLGDSLHGDQLPGWVTRSDQTTDGHLIQLANHHDARLASLDTGIPDAELIPYERDFPSEVRDAAYPRYTDMMTKTRTDASNSNIAGQNAMPGEFIDDPRWTIDPETGYPCVRARPGARKITTEDVKKILRDFP